jgi:hypothetical protein
MNTAFFKILLIPVLGVAQLTAQVTLKVVDWPNNTPANATIYFASSINNWNPGSSSYTLQDTGQGAYEITIPEGVGSVQYKFTRGSWATVEGNATGGEIANRSFTFNGQPQVLELNILTWKDLEGGSGGSSATGNVQILDENFFMPQLNRSRRIWVYLPPDYETSTKHYPVVYMHDGQNLFDNQTSLAADATATGRTTANCQGTDVSTDANKLQGLGAGWKAQDDSKYPVPIRTLI